MSLGLDLKSAIEETGLLFSLHRDGVLQSATNYVWLKSNAQVTKPFIREFFLEGQVAYDLDIKSGDVVTITGTGVQYLVAHSTPDSFENEIYRHSLVLYKANEPVSVVRSYQDRNEDTYLAETHYTIVAEDIYVCVTSPLFGNELNEDSETGPIPSEILEMYIPSSYGVLPKDTVRLDGAFYLVESVKKKRYEGLDVLELSLDNSTLTTTTTTTSTTTTTTAP